MPKQQQGRKRPSRPSALARRKRKEVSFDDVIKQLLELFDHLGLGAWPLAERVADLETADIVPRRIYPHLAAIGELLTSWHQDPIFLDAAGEPRPLKMQGSRQSFTALARKSVPKVPPKILLSELKRMGAVATDSKKLVRVQMRSLPVYEDRRLARQHTLTSLDSFIKTLRHNLNSTPSNSDQLFHRIAGNGAFDVRDIPALKIKIKREGQRFLESIDNWMTRRMASRKRGPKSKTAQVAIGVYLSVDPAQSARV